MASAAELLREKATHYKALGEEHEGATEVQAATIAIVLHEVAAALAQAEEEEEGWP
jgi:hypothetical protein